MLRLFATPKTTPTFPAKLWFAITRHHSRLLGVAKPWPLRPAARPLSRHEMLRHDKRSKRGRIAADLDLEIAGSVTGVERSDKRKNVRQDSVTTGQNRELDPDFRTSGPEIENSLFRKGRGQRIRIPVVEAKGVAMQCVRDLISVGGELGQVGVHNFGFSRSTPTDCRADPGSSCWPS